MEKLNPLSGTTILYKSIVDSYPDFFSMWNSTILDETVATGGTTLGSRLLPAESLADQKRLSAVLQQITTPTTGPRVVGQVLQPFIVANNNTGRDGSVSVTPAWGDAVLHFVVTGGYPDYASFDEAQPAFEDMTRKRIAR